MMMCSNAECGSIEGLKIAPAFVCSYFGLNFDTKRRKRVCQKCYDDAEHYQSILVKMLQENKSLILGPKKPKNQLVTIDDDVSEDAEEMVVEVQLEGGLQPIVQTLMEKYKFEDQINSSLYHIEKKWKENQKKLDDLGSMQAELERSLDGFRKELYRIGEPKVQQLDPIELDELGNVIKPLKDIQISSQHYESTANLPPVGCFKHSQVLANQTVFAMRSSLLAPWGKARVLRIKDHNEPLYVVRFESGGKPRSFPLKYLAYADSSPVQLEVGSRVIAQYMEENNGKLKPSSYYAGVVAESPKYLNRFRYLIFFDDGYAQYCTHEQVMMVCQSPREVWHDIHMNSRSFISSYLKQYPERAMVKLQRGQLVKTELNGHWFQSRVDSIDASLARIYFISENRYEWIYRGSTRLHPLFELLANAEARKSQGATRPTHDMSLMHKKKNAPYVEYTRGDFDQALTVDSNATSAENPVISTDSVRAVARKSTSRNASSVNKISSVTAVQNTDSPQSIEHKGRIKHTMNPYHHNVVFEPHQCSPNCIEDFPFSDGDLKEYNPLCIPMVRGWSREVTKQRNSGRRSVVYRAPCGRRMRNMDEIHRYLRVTGCELGVDLFCFDSYVHCFTEFEPEIIFSKINDITYGKENIRVSCVNSIDRSNPEYVDYCTERIPRPGVNLNLDPNFLVCCDCTDDCQDKEKCQCWQLTIQATSWGPSGKVDPNAGYYYRRLMQNVLTGVYECNSRCSCRKTCLNRVAQRPLKLRLQLFRTEKRGWGIRCLDDIPKGEFICVYAGQLLTEQEANEDGKQFGDEYLAELDLIESIEQAKEGYESDVMSDHEEANSEASRTSNSGDESSTSTDHAETYSNKKHTLFPTQPPQSFTTQRASGNSNSTDSSPCKTRELFGANEHCYVMDAKSTGNIGRYLNHCCKPNVFVQNIFVDTQDLRFPWVGFFAQNYIRAGTELTWDYSYQVGSVPDKILYCHCGSKDCRGRLL